jgi:hypothetical protein
LINERYANHEVRKRLEILGPERGRYCCRTTVCDVIAIPQRDGKRHANANVAGSAGNRFRLFDYLAHALRIVAVIDRRNPGPRIPGKRDRGAKIGIDTRLLPEQWQPKFEGLVYGTRCKGTQTATVIVCVDQRRQHQKSVVGRRRGGDG